MKKINAKANVNWLVSRNEQKFIDLAIDIYSMNVFMGNHFAVNMNDI